MSIPNYATAEATQQFAAEFQSRYSKHAYTQLGRTGLTVSKIGFGTYRCHQQMEIHREALQLALRKGCNIIDTSANYTDGNAEAMIGDVLNEHIVWGDLPREKLVVVSKVGYIQGDNMEIALGKEQSGAPFPEVVKYQPGLWHCIHPEFIEDQITRSLSRMHLDTLDVYLLHNPEYFLNNAYWQKSLDEDTAEKAFYDRLRRAFIQMEKLVKEGLIRFYGISSNNLPLPADAPGFVDLARVWRTYQDACLQLGISVEEGHFAVIQLPFNWLEISAAILKDNEYQGEEYTVLELAEKLDLGVLINRPLNAIHNNRLVRLARYDGEQKSPMELSSGQDLAPLNQLEDRFNKAYPELGQKLSFSQKALLLAANVTGIDVVLNGMRTPEYVQDSMGVLEINQLIEVEKVF